MGLHSQTFPNLLAQFPSRECKALYEDISSEDSCSVKNGDCALPLMVLLLVEGVKREWCCMLEMAIIFSYRSPLFQQQS